MKFSIVVPVYNVKKYLREGLDTLVEQIREIDNDAEIIVVDDGSTDGSSALCDKYEKNNLGIVKVIHKKNGGLLSARRTGFAAAKGEYIINCDSDDKLLPGALKNVVQGLLITNTDVLFYNAEQLLENGTSKIWFENIFSTDEVSMVTKEEVWKNYFNGYATVSMCCKAFRLKCLALEDDYSHFNHINMGEDSLQSIEVYNKAKTFAYLNIPIYGYRMSSGMTAKFDHNFYAQFKVVLNEVLKNKDNINLADFDKRFSKKLFDIVGRSITQGRVSRKLGLTGEKDYFNKISSDELVCRFKLYYPAVRYELQRSHRIVCDFLINGRYGMLYLLLMIMNTIKKG